MKCNSIIWIIYKFIWNSIFLFLNSNSIYEKTKCGDTRVVDRREGEDKKESKRKGKQGAGAGKELRSRKEEDAKDKEEKR